ncbi:hypothetical protein P8452_67617 [Trifolium repens]|nr:hypothetical protein P8452_67617 [Trifolium repens]
MNDFIFALYNTTLNTQLFWVISFFKSLNQVYLSLLVLNHHPVFLCLLLDLAFQGKNDRIKTRNTLVVATVADASRLQKIC